MADSVQPWGVVLAGGRGSRLGGAKPHTDLGGRPLFSWAAESLHEAGLPVVLVTKPAVGFDEVETLPDGTSVTVIEEPEQPVHALMGIVTALERLAAPVVVCACDMPFVPVPLIAWLAGRDGAAAVVCSSGGRMQPMLGRYAPEIAGELRAAIVAGDSVRAVIESLGDRALVVGEDELSRFGDVSRLLFDIDTPADLETAARILDAR